MPKLNNEKENTCDKPISESEIFKSTKHLSSGNTLGSDGLPTDFYKFFWCNIKSLLTQSIIYVMEKANHQLNKNVA